MKNAEIKKLSTQDLEKQIAVDQARLMKLKFSHAVTPLQNPQEIPQLRRHIARLNTELRSRQLSNQAQ